MAAFLRVLNADENLREAIQLLEYAAQLGKPSARRTDARLAKAQIRDAIEVLHGGHLHGHDVVPQLKRALRMIRMRQYQRVALMLQKLRDKMIIRS